MTERVAERGMAKPVGVVGAGALGRALLERLILAGARTTTYDVAADAIEAARAMGTTVVESPAAAARDAAYVHVCVRTDDQVLDATLGTNGAVASMQPGAVLMLHSTVLPQTSRSVGEVASQRGIEVLDATVVGIPAWIRAGDASFLVGGRAEVADAVRPYLLALGRAVYYFGPLGAGNIAKIAKNLATAADRVVMVEVLTLAEAGGLDPRLLLEMMRVEYHSLTRDWEGYFDVENGHAEGRPTVNILNKDIRHAADFAAERGLDLPVTRSVAEAAARWVALWNT